MTYPQNNEGVEVDLMPPTPVGQVNGGISASVLMQQGAALGASGVEQAAVASFLAEVQAVTVQTYLTVLPTLLKKMMAIQRARLVRVESTIRDLPEVPLQMRLGGVFGGMTQVPGYVLKADVLRVVGAAMQEVPPAA